MTDELPQLLFVIAAGNVRLLGGIGGQCPCPRESVLAFGTEHGSDGNGRSRGVIQRSGEGCLKQVGGL